MARLPSTRTSLLILAFLCFFTKAFWIAHTWRWGADLAAWSAMAEPQSVGIVGELMRMQRTTCNLIAGLGVVLLMLAWREHSAQTDIRRDPVPTPRSAPQPPQAQQ